MNPKYSIIIPSHNGELHIRKCLDSVACQWYQNYELIVVCDRCEDDTEKIAKSYRARTITVDYGRDGLSRNAGLDAAQGEYILFLDDDDWWLHEFVLEQINSRISPFVDMLYFSFIWKGRGYCVQSPERSYIAVWNKCWRKDFIGTTRFPSRKYWSDDDFNRMMSYKQGHRVYWDMPMYYYNFMREGSINWIAANGEK